MVALHQELEARLDVGGRRMAFQPQRVERLALGIAHHPAFTRVIRARGTGEVREHSERVGGGTEGGVEASGGRAKPRVARLLAVEPKLPGRAVPGYGILLEAGDRLVAHPGEIIVGLIVFAHVLEAEAPVLAFPQATFGGPMGRRAAASRPLAGGRLRAQPTILIRLHTDAVEEGRVE